MEDAFAAVPHFLKIPIQMLTGDRVLDGVGKYITHQTAHFFGVYDGHGGSQVTLSSKFISFFFLASCYRQTVLFLFPFLLLQFNVLHGVGALFRLLTIVANVYILLWLRR